MGKKRRKRARKARRRNKRARRLWLADMDRYDRTVVAAQQGTIPVPDTGPFDDCPAVAFVPLLHGEASAEDIDKLIEEIAEEVIQDLGLEKGDERQGRAGDPGVADIFDLSGLPPEAFAPPNTDEEMDADCSEAPRSTPTPEEFLPFVDGACDAVLQRLRVGGKRYGENVLFELGEMGAVAQCYTKAARALWSHQSGFHEVHRDDTWLDLAGFAVLEIARKAYVRNLHPDEIDGLFDRGTKKGIR